MEHADTIRIELVVALPERQELASCCLPAGTLAAEAIEQSGVRQRFAEVDFSSCGIAVWGRPVEPDYRLADGDRLEILRPLAIDPRDARRELAKEGQFMGSAGSRQRSSRNF